MRSSCWRFCFESISSATCRELTGTKLGLRWQYFDFLRGQATSLATPTGNFNPFYYGLLALGQFLLSPSLSTLRFASAVSGLALILITYQLIRRLASTHVALASALLMAVLPVNIIYSRIGWGPSQTVLAALVVVFFGVQLRTIALSVAFLAAFLVHPTTVFLMPVALAPLLYHEVYVKGRRFTSLALPIGGLGVLTLAGALMTYLAQPETVGAVLQKIPDRLRDPATLWNVAIHYVQLFSGTTSYRYICGSAYSSRTVVWDVVVALLMLGLLVFGGLRVWRKKGVGLALLGGLLISLAGSCAVAGPEILYPHYERYGLFLVAPSVLIFSVLIGELPRLGSHPWRMLGLVSLAGWFFLGTFALDFVGFLFQTGGRSEYTFRTGPKEPKQAAYDIIETDRPPRSQIIVLASSWWNYMPIRYLMAYRGNLDEGDRVINLHAAPENVSPLPQTTAANDLRRDLCRRSCRALDTFWPRIAHRAHVGGQRLRRERAALCAPLDASRLAQPTRARREGTCRGPGGDTASQRRRRISRPLIRLEDQRAA